VGDAIARVLEAAGADVAREFYINDRGLQMDRFGQSLEARAMGTEVPEGGYQGEYVDDLARQAVAADPGLLGLEGQARWEAFREAGYALQLQQQRETLDAFNTHFDVWYSERTLHSSGAVERGLEKLREQGHMFEADGAVWLRTTDFDDDRDRVLVRSNGELTYFASDTAYYVDKRARGFDVCIYLLGADHHGYVNRLRAVAACAGDDPDRNIEVLIGQLVKMVKGGEEVRLSKRAGNMITLEDLVDEVGVDAARYSLIRYPVDSPLTLDLDLLVSRSNDNPVFYVQYAHARISSVLRNAEELGIDWRSATFDPSLLTHEREAALLGLIGELPRVVATAAELREPHRVARYLEELANGYHKFYDVCRVLPMSDAEPEPINIARLWLCAAARQTLANGLAMLGVTAPERM
jgi:arginyl-tRNA synthetase